MSLIYVDLRLNYVRKSLLIYVSLSLLRET